MHAISQELNAIHLGDARLDRRGRMLLSRFAENPAASIPAACRGWSETDAAYKFFANPRVDAEGILKPHAEATLERCRREPVVLLVQDTTELDYTHENLPIEGLGVLDHRDRRGMHLHAQVAFTPQGCCLGVVGATFFTRAEESIGQARERTYWPIEEKESVRWLEGYRQACAIQRELITRRVVSIADREADIYEIFAERERNVSQHRWRQADFVIRSKENRSLPEKAEDAGPWCYQKLWSALHESPERFRRTLDLSATPQHSARQVTLAVRACELTLKPPYRRDRKLPPVTVCAVLAQEIDPPEGEDGVEWLLLSSLPIDRRDQIETILDYYRGRWPIEASQAQYEHKDNFCVAA